MFGLACRPGLVSGPGGVTMLQRYNQLYQDNSSCHSKRNRMHRISLFSGESATVKINASFGRPIYQSRKENENRDRTDRPSIPTPSPPPPYPSRLRPAKQLVRPTGEIHLHPTARAGCDPAPTAPALLFRLFSLAARGAEQLRSSRKTAFSRDLNPFCLVGENPTSYAPAS